MKTMFTASAYAEGFGGQEERKERREEKQEILCVLCVLCGFIPSSLARSCSRRAAGKMELRGDHFNAGRKTELVEEFLAVVPRQAEGAHVGHAETGNNGRKYFGVTSGKLAVQQGVLRPIHQLRERGLVMEIRGDFVGDGLFRDRHDGILHLFVSFIHREFFMRLNQLPLVIVNLLPETHRGFFRIHFLEITRVPSKPARYIQTITPSATGQCLPTAKLLFILTAGAHFSAAVRHKFICFP
jgi:hypothetical protein